METRCESRVTLDDFSLDPNALDTPLSWSFGRGICTVPQVEARKTPFFRPSGWVLIGIIPPERGYFNNPPPSRPPVWGPQPPSSWEEDLSSPSQTHRQMFDTQQPLPWLGKISWSPLWDAMFLDFPDSSFSSPIFPSCDKAIPFLGLLLLHISPAFPYFLNLQLLALILVIHFSPFGFPQLHFCINFMQQVLDTHLP